MVTSGDSVIFFNGIAFGGLVRSKEFRGKVRKRVEGSGVNIVTKMFYIYAYICIYNKTVKYNSPFLSHIFN